MGAPRADFLEDDVMARLEFVGQRIYQFTHHPSQGSSHLVATYTIFYLEVLQ